MISLGRVRLVPTIYPMVMTNTKLWNTTIEIGNFPWTIVIFFHSFMQTFTRGYHFPFNTLNWPLPFDHVTSGNQPERWLKFHISRGETCSPCLRTPEGQVLSKYIPTSHYIPIISYHCEWYIFHSNMFDQQLIEVIYWTMKFLRWFHFPQRSMKLPLINTTVMSKNHLYTDMNTDYILLMVNIILVIIINHQYEFTIIINHQFNSIYWRVIIN